MANFLLVHGAFFGAWCWRRVVPQLRSRAHDVYAVTLTGLGERSHLLTPEVGLHTHVDDVVNLLEFQDLREVVLVGHSYAGMVVGCVSHRVPERIAQLVYLDQPQSTPRKSSKSASPRRCMMWIRLWLIQALTPKEELASLHSQILSNLERAWELTGGSEDQFLSTMMQISQVVARQFNKQE